MGADAFLTPDPDRSLAEQSRDALGDAPDIVFDCAGAPGSLDGAIAAVRFRGRIVAPGICWTPDPITPIAAMVKEANLLFTWVYNRREFEIAVAAFDRGRVEPRAMITKVVDLQGAPAAFAELLGCSSQCKVMIRPF
jgi:(R,R)-butanediol dehydrogenase/meso-butanediol dehydrogenase/diacetyl reductase